MTLLIAAVLTTVLGAGPAWAREQQVTIRSTDASRYPNVSLTATLSGEDATQLPVLTEKHFFLQENSRAIEGIEVKPIFKEPEPVAVVLVLDISGSMKGEPLENAKTAARSFLGLMKPQDKIGVVAFGSGPQIVSPLTGDKNSLRQAIDGLAPSGETALYDGILAGLDIFSQASLDSKTHKNLVVLSDGKDTTSLNPFEAVFERAKESDIPIFGVGLQSPEFDSTALAKICEVSGGQLLLTPDSSTLNGLYAELARELHMQYLLTYKSRATKAKKLKIQLEMRLFGQNINARTTITNPRPQLSSDQALDKSPVKVPKSFGSPYILAGSLLLSFLAAFLIALALISILYVRDKNLRDQLKFYDSVWRRSRLKTMSSDDSSGDQDSPTVRRNILDNALKFTDYFASRRGFREFIQEKLEQAGLPLRPLEFILVHFLFTLIMVFVGRTLARSPSGIIVVSGIAAGIGVLLPLFALRVLADIRKNRFHEQLPNTLNMISGAMRAGYGLVQALNVAAKESVPPMSTELTRALTEARLGIPLEEALQNMAQRLNEDNFTWTVMAINIQREVGGNLAELLEIIADTIRERDKVKRQIKILTAEGRLSAMILALLPIFLALLLFILNPSYMAILVQTVLGLAMIGFGLILFTIGVLWLKKITTIEV